VSDIQIEVHDGIAVATIDRPERLNAFRRRTYDDLHAIATRLDGETSWRALVVTGAGRAFCAGQDLGDVPRGELDPADLKQAVDQLQDITRKFALAGKPTVAAINGPAVGFGLEFTLALDLRIASPKAYFILPELVRGLFQTNGTFHYLAPLIGRGLAGDMILTGRRVDVDEALRAGLVSRIVPGEDLLAQAIAIAMQLSNLDRIALGYAREGLRTLGGGSLEDALQFESRACVDLLTSGSLS
jgi:2-(1,2-epoxy-1,2-dihydrophenyl)acetyl-CoA isomerase